MGGRRPRERAARGASVVGRRFEVTVGPAAHGGHCVARLPEGDDGSRGRVVFVRHALPGERVVVSVTEGTEGDRFWRADAVDVLEPAADRVTAPCPVAGPGGCGGCDLQHVALPAQREWKADVVREQLVRIGGLPSDHPLLGGLEVEAVPGDSAGLRWRTRMSWARTADGRPGMRRHRSRSVVPVEDCLIAAPDARVGQSSARGEPDLRERVETRYGTREFARAPDGFWQVHPGAPRVLVETVLDLLAPRPGERALDLYAGVGLFSAFLAERVSGKMPAGEVWPGEVTGVEVPAGEVTAVEGDPAAGEHAARNLADLPVRVETGRVDRVLARTSPEPVDLVVLDPPREGARRPVVEQVVARRPRAVAYVACDPAALARDVAIFGEHGYRPAALRAFDLFPMTHHVECVALLTESRKP